MSVEEFNSTLIAGASRPEIREIRRKEEEFKKSSGPGQRNGERGKGSREEKRETWTRCWPSGLDGESERECV